MSAGASRMRGLLFAAAAAAAIIAGGCREDKRETISISADPETFPTMRTVNVSTLISDSGYTRYHITAPLWLMFEEAREPHWKFPDGMYMVKFDNDMKENGTFTADTATYFSQKRLWRFDRNVRYRSTDGDRLLTQQLFWDQNRQIVYSDSFIHLERADRTIEGFGFEADQNMREYKVHRPSGIFPTSAFRKRGSETGPAPSPDASDQSDGTNLPATIRPQTPTEQ